MIAAIDKLFAHFEYDLACSMLPSRTLEPTLNSNEKIIYVINNVMCGRCRLQLGFRKYLPVPK